MLNQLRRVPGIADVRIQQAFDYPSFNVDVDRTKATQGGFTESDVADSLLNSLSGSFQMSPMFFSIRGMEFHTTWLRRRPSTISSRGRICRVFRSTGPSSATWDPRRCGLHPALAEMQVINHYNIRRVIDIYASAAGPRSGRVSGRRFSGSADQNRKLLPRGSFITVRGQLETMRASYVGLVSGLGFSIVLVYLLIVVNFQSWLDPFVIITALPAALAGIVLFLFVTHTTLSVPALMGAIMCMGVATANSILVVSFAKERLAVSRQSGPGGD